jgi:hypothetical protein
MEGASWTNHMSWVQGYENVLTPMTQLSARFHEKWDPLLQGVSCHSVPITRTSAYRRALLYNLVLQTSCFRYWGQGLWTDYAQKIFEQGLKTLA